MSFPPSVPENLQNIPPSGFGGNSFAAVPHSLPASSGGGSLVSVPASDDDDDAESCLPESTSGGFSVAVVPLSLHASSASRAPAASTTGLAITQASRFLRMLTT